MEILHTQIKIQWPHIFLILEAKRKQNNNAELSNSPVKTCSKSQKAKLLHLHCVYVVTSFPFSSKSIPFGIRASLISFKDMIYATHLLTAVQDSQVSRFHGLGQGLKLPLLLRILPPQNKPS